MGTPPPPEPRSDEVFESERSRLTGLAYRMLGSIADAEDVVQSAWLRWDATERDTIVRPAAWLTTVVARLAIDRMRQQQRRREDYVGPWLPEPVATRIDLPATSTSRSEPERAAELADSVTFGFLVLLDRLGPVERAVFVLADVFGEPFPSIAELVGRSPEACRQIASRARRRLRSERLRTRPADERLLTELVSALALGEVDRVLELVSPDVVVVNDGGPDRHAARRPVVGADRAVRFLVNLAQRSPADATFAFEEVNGAPAFVLRSSSLEMVMTAECDLHGRIETVRAVLNPDKLGGIDHVFDIV